MRICPSEWNAHPQSNEDAEELNDVSVSDGIKSTEERVEDGYASREDDRSFLFHVNDNSKSCPYKRNFPIKFSSTFPIFFNQISPKAARIPAAQNTSPQSAGKKSNPPIRSPKLSCNGSSIVTYPCFLIGFAKNRPPAMNWN